MFKKFLLVLVALHMVVFARVDPEPDDKGFKPSLHLVLRERADVPNLFMAASCFYTYLSFQNTNDPFLKTISNSSAIAGLGFLYLANQPQNLGVNAFTKAACAMAIVSTAKAIIANQTPDLYYPLAGTLFLNCLSLLQA